MLPFSGVKPAAHCYIDLQISDWVPDPETNLLSRKFSYIKTLNGVVKQTKCELIDETIHCDFDDYITMFMTTRTPDVPSGNAFSVKTRTCPEAAQELAKEGVKAEVFNLRSIDPLDIETIKASVKKAATKQTTQQQFN